MGCGSTNVHVVGHAQCDGCRPRCGAAKGMGGSPRSVQGRSRTDSIGCCPQWTSGQDHRESRCYCGVPEPRQRCSMAAPECPTPECGEDFATRHAWPALLAQAQANRVLLTLAIRGQARDSAMLQAQALANRDAAAAQLHAMRTLGDANGHAAISDELQCWHSDAHETATTASHVVRTVSWRQGAGLEP